MHGHFPLDYALDCKAILMEDEIHRESRLPWTVPLTIKAVLMEDEVVKCHSLGDKVALDHTLDHKAVLTEDEAVKYIHDHSQGALD